MGSRLSFFVLVALYGYAVVSFGHPLRAPRLVRLISPSTDPEGNLETRFRATRQAFEGGGFSPKDLPRCKQEALERATKIDETCLSCTTNVDTGRVSECPEGCCRTFEITEDLDTGHFITCYQGCCSRSVAVLSDSSDREAGLLNFEGVFSVNNDVTLNEITALGQCMVQEGRSKGCGSSCAELTAKDTRCSNANSLRVPAVGRSFADPPCAEAEDMPGSKGSGDESASSSTDVGTDTGSGANGDGGNGADLGGDDDIVGDGDRNVDNGNNEGSEATGPANDENEGKNSNDGDSSGPVDDGGVIGDADENLEASPTEEVEESPPEETDDGLGETTQVGEETMEATGEQNVADGTDTDDPVCFPAAATVELVSGHRKRMKELQTSDQVLVRAGTHSRVFGFTHQNKDYYGEFVELHTKSGHTLRLTNGHYMYSDGIMRKARDVRIGHTVRLGNGSTSDVTEIGKWTGYGLFNPQTVDGDIVVDGVVVSTYTEAIDARMAHALLTPVRAMSEWVDVSPFLNWTAASLRSARKGLAPTTSSSI